MPLSGSTSPTEHILCSFALEACEALRCLPYSDWIQFLKSKDLCCGCLSSNHAVKECPERKTCTVANCGRKHLRILLTNTFNQTRAAEIRAESTLLREESTSLREEFTHVRNTMMNLACSKIGMAEVSKLTLNYLCISGQW